MQVKRRRASVRVENASYWMSYSDIMAALLLMLILLLFFYVNQYLGLQETRAQELAQKELELRTQEELLQQTEDLLAQRATELAAARGLLNNQEVELQDKNQRLEDSLALLAQNQLELEDQKLLLAFAQQEAESIRQKLDAQQLELDERSLQLSDQDRQLLLQQLELETLQGLLTQQQTTLNTQEQELGQQSLLLGRQQEMIDELVGVRAQIIAQLRNSLSQANLNFNVDQNTGAITLDSAVFFDYGRNTIKESGKALLDEFMPIYVRTLLMGEDSQYVSELIIEGHTDSTGTYEYNLNLSQQRAFEVVRYCLSDAFTGLTAEEKNLLRERVSANGRSFNSPILNEDGTENAEASRRVEFKFRLKDAEMIDDMRQILEGN